ncbi:uncharacterized protein [Phyllobates terribilis]|uniref:uncharacterized protein n=1 Tax=Phyllobates terribilis TaxID=111132 RepID=UPI003CCB3D1A
MNIHIDVILAGLCMGILVCRSDSISPPILSASPNHLSYYEGETVTLTCAIQEGYRPSQFTFYKNSEYIPTDSTHIYKVHGMRLSDVGSYSCDFWTGRHSSPRSNEVLLLFYDKLPRPVIILEPSHTVYKIGESITITCSPPRILKEKMIRFYKEGYVQPLNEAKDNIYVITISNKGNGGRYSCTYSTEIQDRRMTSLPSEYIIVNVSVSTGQTTAATIVHETPTLDMRSKTSISTGRTTAATKVQEMPTLDLRSKTSIFTRQTTAATMVPETSTLEMTSKKLSLLRTILYFFYGGLILMIVCIIILVVCRFYIPQNGKREGTVVAPPVSESNLSPEHNMKTIEQPLLYHTALQEMETEHFYSEIDLSILNTTTPFVSMYAKAKAIDPLPPVYQTDLTAHARN